MVFDYVPYLQGRYLTYEEYFALYLMIYTGAAALLLFTGGMGIAFFCGRSDMWPPGYSGIQRDKSRVSASSIFFWLGAFALASFLSVFSMFDWVSVWVTITTSFIVIGTRFLCWCSSLDPGAASVREAVGTTAADNPLSFRLLLFAGVAFSLFTPILTTGLCVCINSPEIGMNVYDMVYVNSRITRLLTYSRQCTDTYLCYLYLTVPEDPAHFVFVNAQTSKSAPNLHIRYGTKQYALSNGPFMTRFPLEGLEGLGERDVHSALLSGLASNTRYFFQVYSGNDPFSIVFSFRTCPSPADNVPLRLVIGGDAGTNSVSYQTAYTAGALNPHLVAIGGDVAYDNAIVNCYQSWDRFLYMIQTRLVTSEQDLIPVILAIGNHDVGLNSLSERKIEVSNKGPMVFAMFPQHFARDADGGVIHAVPEISDRRSYFYHLPGNTLLLSLDSGHMTEYSGEQRDWMETVLSQFQGGMKFAQYHQPIYGSVKRPDFDVLPVAQGLQYWVPLFDAYKLTVAFENHVHAFKRTIPLKNSQPDDTGTVYCGDGQWGTPNATDPLDNDPWLFTSTTTKNHFWVVEVNGSQAVVRAVSSEGEEMDRFKVLAEEEIK